MPRAARRRIGSPLWILLVFSLPGGLGLFLLTERPPALLDRIRQSGHLVVLTRNAPTTYFEDRAGPNGFEYRLTQAFAAHLGIDRVDYVVLDTIDAIIQALNDGRGDIAAAGITRLPSRERLGIFGPTYLEVHELLVCHRGVRPRPLPLDRLPEQRLRVASGTSYIATLIRLRRQIPGLGWEISSERSTEQILADVAARRIDCTVADSNIVRINQRYHPELVIERELGPARPLAWMIPRDARGLQSVLASWFKTIRADGRLQRIIDASYGHIPSFDYVDILTFKKRIRRRLPRYRPLFEAAADEVGLPWTLLAAQAYQESHWLRTARSPTGVRGIMMLTLETARSLGVENRLDARQSIPAGARYLRHLIENVPETVNEEDRIWFALAAYNIGMGHVLDARRLARRLGLEANDWPTLARVLPLLTQRRYYRHLPHGYARGTEAVRYVRHIRNYQAILEQHLLAEQEDKTLAADPLRVPPSPAGNASRAS